MTDVMNGRRGSPAEMTLVDDCNLVIEGQMRARSANDTGEVQLHLCSDCVEECRSRGGHRALSMMAASQRLTWRKEGKNDKWVGKQERHCAMVAAGIPGVLGSAFLRCWISTCVQVQPSRAQVLDRV